jgi:hypothetical protein
MSSLKQQLLTTTPNLTGKQQQNFLDSVIAFIFVNDTRVERIARYARGDQHARAQSKPEKGKEVAKLQDQPGEGGEQQLASASGTYS